jgi:hypothetical protein
MALENVARTAGRLSFCKCSRRRKALEVLQSWKREHQNTSMIEGLITK